MKIDADFNCRTIDTLDQFTQYRFFFSIQIVIVLETNYYFKSPQAVGNSRSRTIINQNKLKSILRKHNTKKRAVNKNANVILCRNGWLLFDCPHSVQDSMCGSRNNWD